jgi:hypothetical protein
MLYPAELRARTLNLHEDRLIGAGILTLILTGLLAAASRVKIARALPPRQRQSKFVGLDRLC